MLSLFVLLPAAATLFAADSARPLATLRQAHPRLIALDSDIARIRELVKSDPAARRLYNEIAAEAGRLEQAAPVVHQLVGPRLLAQSRRALDRIYTLALMYRLDGKPQYLKRAVRELRAAADFPDWNPSHFLDTAEMTHAFAIGYDWLYPALSGEERAWIRKAIVEKGLNEALPIYEKQRWWVTAHHNWNQVCNGGIGIGALAIAESEPARSETILKYAVQSIPRAMASYAPDGGWNEGPGYWHYATRYNVYFLAALETALGTDFGLSKLPGFDRAGHFRVYFSGPSNQTFNYADAGAGTGNAAEMFWLAKRFSQPVYAWQEQEQLARREAHDALDLVWFRPDAQSPSKAGWPLDSFFEGVQVAFLRGSWDDSGSVWVAVKGGDNKANHSHLDLGSFVLDALGVRWASDFGGDDYNLPRYFGDLRWTYYRLRTESHNTVLIDGENQDPKGAARVIDRSFQPQLARVRFDLAGGYPKKVTRLERAVSLVERRQVVIEDRVEADNPVDALWEMVTEAEVELTGTSARLTRSGKALSAEIRSPKGAAFQVVSTQPPAPQRQNKGSRKLVVRLPDKVREATITVALTPEKK